MAIVQTIRNINRIREIIGILLKYGFEDLVMQTPIRRFVSQKRALKLQARGRTPASERSRWERIRMVTEELGPTFIKLAQVLSNRPDMVPSGLIEEWEKLQSAVPPFPPERARKIIEKETGKTIDELFGEFEDKPLGSASIGQVHKAKLITGEEVVIKVRRPGVGKKIAQDMEILKELVKLGENYLNRQGVIHPMDVVLSFEKSMKKELNYQTEARNLEQFYTQYKNYPKFRIPKAYKEFSTEKVLIMEYFDGCKLTDIEQLKKWNLNPETLAEAGMSAYLTMIFDHGFFHADPHPGNVLVDREGSICLIDFGMVGKLMRPDKQALAGIFVAMANKDPRAMALHFKRLATEDSILDNRAFEYDLSEIIDDFASLDVAESNMAELSIRLQKVSFDYRLRIPGGVFLVLRALAILEGIGKTIHPSFNSMEFMKPYGKRIVQEMYSFENITNEMIYRGSTLYSMLSNFPFEVKSILKKARKGTLKFEVEHRGYDPLLDQLDRITNKLILGVLIASILLSSSIILLSNIGQGSMRYGIPLLSLAGFISAIGLGFLLSTYFINRR